MSKSQRKALWPNPYRSGITPQGSKPDDFFWVDESAVVPTEAWAGLLAEAQKFGTGTMKIEHSADGVRWQQIKDWWQQTNDWHSRENAKVPVSPGDHALRDMARQRDEARAEVRRLQAIVDAGGKNPYDCRLIFWPLEL